MVLENELEVCVKNIDTCKVNRKPIPPEIEDRKMQIEIKIQMMVFMIENGDLDMPLYLSQLEEEISEIQKSIGLFERFGKLDLLKRAQTRLKIMSTELADAKGPGKKSLNSSGKQKTLGLANENSSESVTEVDDFETALYNFNE
jgi:hypothetical protein